MPSEAELDPSGIIGHGSRTLAVETLQSHMGELI